MDIHTGKRAPAPDSDQKFKRILGTPSLVMFGIAYMVPLGVFTTYGIVAELTEGRLPLAYLLTIVAVLFTASSYGKMVRVHPNAGSAYAYATRAFGTRIGFVVGWGTLIDYLLLPMVNYLVIGIYMQASFPDVPFWVWIVIAFVGTTVLNVLGIKFVSGANFFLLAVQFIFIAIFVALAFSNPVETSPEFLAMPFTLGEGGIGVIASGAAVLVFSFIGFDAISTLAEDAKNPRKSIPRAVILAPVIGGVLFIAVSFAGHLVFPAWQDFTNVDSAALDVILATGGKILSSFFIAAYVVGCFASAMIGQATVSRILFSMGRDGLLPKKVFAVLSDRFGSPVWTVLIVGVISLLAIVLSLDFVATVISFGALTAFTVANLAVIKTYAKDKKHEGPVKVISHIVIPLIGAALTVWLWTSLASAAFITGLIWMAVGFLWLLVTTRFFTKPTPALTDI